MINKNVEIGTRLKEFALNNFFSLTEFAKQMGRGPTFFTRYYLGESLLGGELLIKLSELGCDIDWLLTGKKQETKTQINHSQKVKGNIFGESATIMHTGESSVPYVSDDDMSYTNLLKEKIQKLQKDNQLLTEELNQLRGTNAGSAKGHEKHSKGKS